MLLRRVTATIVAPPMQARSARFATTYDVAPEGAG